MDDVLDYEDADEVAPPAEVDPPEYEPNVRPGEADEVAPPAEVDPPEYEPNVHPGEGQPARPIPRPPAPLPPVLAATFPSPAFLTETNRLQSECHRSLSIACVRLPYFVPSVHFPVANSPYLKNSYRMNRSILCDSDIDGLYPHIPPGLAQEVINSNHSYHLRTIEGSAITDSQLPLDEWENKIFIATMLSYTTPASNGSVYGNQAQLRNAATLVSPTKRIRTGIHSMTSNSKCIMLGDCSPNSGDVLCLILPGHNPLYGAAGQTSFADSIRVGDVIGILEPDVSTRTLGEKIPIIEKFTRIVPLKKNLYIPPKTIKMSNNTLEMTHFCDHSLVVSFTKASFLTNKDVPCTNITCDRQNTTCRGCRGKDATSQNYVVQVHVRVHDQYNYENQGGVATFLCHRSFDLTKQFVDVGAFRSVDVSTMVRHSNALRDACQRIADHVNANGGWTLVGWHRRGVSVNNADGSVEVRSMTQGHIVRLEPTRQTPALLQELSTLKLR